MRLIAIQQCRSGMRLGKPIYNEEGLPLLNSGVALTENMLTRLNSRGIDFLYIEDQLTEDLEIPDMLSDETRIKALGLIRSTFRKLADAGPSKRIDPRDLDGAQFRVVMKLILDDLSTHHPSMIMLTDIGITDNYLYRHSLNVCIYTAMLGMYGGCGKEDLLKLGMGALLHDIGKTRIPLEILRKPGKLSDAEFAEMKRHTEIGFELLRKADSFPLIAAHCAYQHHERCDGSGYPRGLKDEEIHQYAKLLGIADSYDAMTSHRVYRSAMLPHVAMERLFTGAGTLYDIELLRLFRDHLALYPLGATVQLSGGERGVVVRINPAVPHRPVVRLYETAAGDPLTEPCELDMSRELSRMIMNVNEIKAEMYL